MDQNKNNSYMMTNCQANNPKVILNRLKNLKIDENESIIDFNNKYQNIYYKLPLKYANQLTTVDYMKSINKISYLWKDFFVLDENYTLVKAFGIMEMFITSRLNVMSKGNNIHTINLTKTHNNEDSTVNKKSLINVNNNLIKDKENNFNMTSRTNKVIESSQKSVITDDKQNIMKKNEIKELKTKVNTKVDQHKIAEITIIDVNTTKNDNNGRKSINNNAKKALTPIISINNNIKTSVEQKLPDIKILTFIASYLVKYFSYLLFKVINVFISIFMNECFSRYQLNLLYFQYHFSTKI